MGFERCHPAVNLIYFAAVLFGTVTFRHPIFLLISLTGAACYGVKRNGRSALAFLAVLPLFVAVFALIYATFAHFGVTVLAKNAVGNPVTLESLVYGAVLGAVTAAAGLWASCLFSVFSADKAVYLLGRIGPKLSLALTVLLRLIPQIGREYRSIRAARRGIGRGPAQGGPWRRLRNAAGILSALITRTADFLLRASQSMRSRGAALRGRTAFSIYRFDSRDRLCAEAGFACLAAMGMAMALGQTRAFYDPRILIPPVTPVFAALALGYAGLCAAPLLLELWTERRFAKARGKIVR